MKSAAILLAIGVSILGGASFMGTSPPAPPRLRNTAVKSVEFVPVAAPDCVIGVSGQGQASLSAPVELSVTLANKGAAPLTYIVTNEAFSIALRNLDDGKACPPTALGESTYARPPAGKRLLVRCATVQLAANETHEWKVDLREVFELSAADFEVDVCFELRVPNVGRVRIVSPPIHVDLE